MTAPLAVRFVAAGCRRLPPPPRRSPHRLFSSFLYTSPSPNPLLSPVRDPNRDHPSIDPDPFLTDAARRAANASSYRTSPGAGPHLGPFAMPRGPEGERGLGEEEGRRWREAGWGERGKRAARGLRNGVVIAFGGTLGVLVIYSIVSELAGSTSPTNLMSSLSKHLTNSPSLHTILHHPLSFHGGSSASTSTKLRRHRGPSQSIEVDPITHREVMRVRFWVEGGEGGKEGGKRSGWREWEWWRTLPRRLVGPLITSESPPPPPPTREEIREREERERREREEQERGRRASQVWGAWLTGVFGALMPTSLGRGKGAGRREGEEKRGWFESKPPLGKYRSGEVTAELIKDPGGIWTYRAFYVDFPDAHVRHFRLDVLDELRDAQAAEMTREGERKFFGWRS